MNENKIMNHKSQINNINLFDSINSKLDSDNEVISNIKFIGKIREGDKINTRGKAYIQHDNFYTKISRTFISPDNKENTYLFVSGNIKQIFEILYKYLPDRENRAKKMIIGNILEDIRNATTGIRNLEKTYEEYTLFVSKLQTLIQDILSNLENISIIVNNINNV